MLNALASGLMGLGAFFSFLLFGVPAQPPVQPNVAPVEYGSYSPTGGGTYRLGQSVGTSDITIRLSSFKEPVSNIPYTMSYLSSDIEYGTLSPQSSISEFISFSGITQNSDGSATLTGVTRGLSRTPGTGGCVASTTLAQPHAGQSIFILSNPPCQLAEYAPLRSTATISAVWTYSTTPTITNAPVNNTDAANKAYVDGVAVAGASNANLTTKGIVQLPTALQIASSTKFGSTGAALGLTASSSTSTPSSAMCGLGCIVATQNNGKISPSFLNGTDNYTFNGNNTFTGTTTMATSTMASTTVTTLNVTGTTTFIGAATGITGKLYLNTSPTIDDNSTASTTIFTYTLPANILSTANIVHVHINIHGIGVDNSAGNSYFGASYGGVSTSSINLGVSAQTMRGAGGMDIYLVGTGATNSQKMTSTLIVAATSTAASEGGASISKSIAVDSTIPQNIVLEWHHDTASASSFFEPDLVWAELIK